MSIAAQVPSGGGLIVNEYNQGGSGIKEFIELLVLGDPANPCAPVDLTGWVFDDNSGTFESCGGGVGIADGHYRFTSSYNAVMPGALIVIYNSGDVYTGMPAADPLDADGNNVYIIPSNSAYLEINAALPNAVTPDCSYAGPYTAPGAFWAAGMANSGDACQVRKPDYSFFHGMSFGNVNTVYPAWPAGAAAGTSWNKGSGNLAFDCGSCWSSANYFTTTAGAGTPGAANTVNNANFINNISNCVIDYTNLDDVDNCALVLYISTSDFTVSQSSAGVHLKWSDIIISEAGLRILHSSDGRTFTPIFEQSAADYLAQSPQHNYTHHNPGPGIHYYQLEWNDGDITHSDIQSITYTTTTITLTPNPGTGILQLCGVQPNQHYQILNFLGQTLQSGQFTTTNPTINLNNLPAGCYVLKIGAETWRVEKR